MKKATALVLSLLLILSLVACGGSESKDKTESEGKSAAIIEAEKAIRTIGEVTIDSEEAIKNAEKLYGILTDSEKSQVKNRLDLVDARDAFDTLKAKQIFDNAKEAYNKIAQASTMCIDGMDDIYGAWQFGIYEADECSISTVFSYMALETSFTYSQLEAAAANCGLDSYDCVYGAYGVDEWQCCLWVVMQAHEDAGTHTTINGLLSQAEVILKDMGTEYSDYEYYPTLKEYYSKVSSYASFFAEPTGSFEQLKTTINDYENSIRTLNSDLEFVFKESISDGFSEAVGV